MAIRNMTALRIRNALEGVDLTGVGFSKNEIVIHIEDEHGFSDSDVTEAKVSEVWNAIGDGWMRRGGANFIWLYFDPHGELSRAFDAEMRDQLGPAYEG